MRPLRIIALVLLLAAPVVVTAADLHAQSPTLRVIINAQNPAATVERKFLTDAFLKKATRWSHDELIRPVDLRPDLPARRTFSEDVLKRSIAAVKTYWQQMVFSGHDVPPPELDSEQEVVRFVVRYPGAVGYVSATTSIAGVKVLNVR